jgi:hypothetical protein
MRRLNMNVVKLFFIPVFIMISLSGNSQEIKMSRKERKELRKEEMTANFKILDSLLNSKRFVLEAEYLRNKYGQSVPVFSSLNFIKIDRTHGVIQTGSNVALGYNGVGGVTAEGHIGKWDIKKNPGKLNYTIHFTLLTQIGHYDVFMTINSDNFASATITGLWPGTLTWEGHLETIGNSRIFKGKNTV